MDLSTKIKLLIIGAVIFLGGNVIGFTQGLKAAIFFENKPAPALDSKSYNNSCDGQFLLHPDLLFHFNFEDETPDAGVKEKSDRKDIAL